MARLEKRKLERVRYWQGQMLRSRDFLDIEAVETQRRWWHNRALHNAYGVAEGLTCSLVPATSPFTGVSVGPGVAYDVFGRELILEKPLSIALPSNIPQGAVSLLMRYKPPSRGLRPDEISEVCWTACGSVAAGTAEFVWKLNDNLPPTDGVSVFAAYHTLGTFRGPDPNYVRVSTQPLARPSLASGTTIPGNTPWEPWSVGFFSPAGALPVRALIGVQTWIDTSAAGFTRIPCYFAALQGPVWNPQTRQLTPAIFPSIADESITGFTFRLWLQVPDTQTFEAVRLQKALQASSGNFSFVTDPSDFSLFAREQELYVSWIGCQMPVPVSRCTTQAESSGVGVMNQASASSRKS